VPLAGPAQPAQAGEPLDAAGIVRGTSAAERHRGERALDQRGSFAGVPGEHGGQPGVEIGLGSEVRMCRSQRAQPPGDGGHAVRIGAPPPCQRGVGQRVGGGVRVATRQQCGRGGEQIGGAPDMAGSVLGVPAQVQHAATQVIFPRAGQGPVEQPVRARGVSGQPRGIGSGQPPPGGVLRARRQPGRLFGGPGGGSEPGPP
jgi:hypothetical protein